MTCHYCDQKATCHCSKCARDICERHEFDNDCLDCFEPLYWKFKKIKISDSQ